MEYGLIFRSFCSLNLCLGLFVGAEQPSNKVREAVAPYLMPSDHPIKALLDTLFTSSRAILNLDKLQEAGFAKAYPRKFTKLIVTTHPAFPGYIFKLYLDAQRFHKNLPESHLWIWRVLGARMVQDVITARGLGRLFKVPQKWIYELPRYHMPPKGYCTKYYILVEEDMELVSCRENKALWAGSHVSTSLLDGLYVILKRVGLSDCAKPHNIPFSYDGRVAFIDTQTSGSKHISYSDLTHSLSKPNQQYWKDITD